MNRSLRVSRECVASNLLASQGEALQVGLGDQLGPQGAGDHVVTRFVGTADAHVPKGVDDALVGHDAVGDYQIA
jgi:hypothetical protein